MLPTITDLLWCLCTGHSWGGWVGSNVQPILKRRCSSCGSEDTKPDQKKLKWLEKNCKSCEDGL